MKPTEAPETDTEIPEKAVCWGCGQLYDVDRLVRNGAGRDRHTCRSCKNQDKGVWMNCDGCGAARRPQAPGQITFTCNDYQRNRT